MHTVLADFPVGLDSVRSTREFLGISGLLRFPQFRVLTPNEKQNRLRRLMRDSAPPKEVRKAHALIHRNEQLLRFLIDRCMADQYGCDWPQARLPLCECKKLLGKTLDDGESVLDHADYKHYELIMCHDEHFEVALAHHYTDVDSLRAALARLGNLRARALHGRSFVGADLKEMTLLWRVIGVGFAALVHEVVHDEG